MSAGALLALAVAFAFPNEQGTRLLATGEIAQPEALQVALCAGGQHLPVRYERRQVEGTKSTGRQSPPNFANAAGAVFEITRGHVSAGSACVLAGDAFAADTTPVPLTRPPDAARCTTAHYPTFQQDKGRPVVGCWPIAQSAGGTHVAIVEFSRRLNQALAALVVVDGDRRMYVDYPADFRGPGSDLWRADDGGEIHAEGFEVVFLLKRGSTYFLAVDWRAGEGNALSLHAAEGAGQFKELITESWYRSPL
jgi:hypothetical protein